MKADETKTYWHICEVDASGTPRLGYGDGREVRVGETLTMLDRGQPTRRHPSVCERGMHACKRLMDCLSYSWNNNVICKVRLSGMIVDGGYKVAARKRTVVAMTSQEAGRRILREWRDKMNEERPSPDAAARLLEQMVEEEFARQEAENADRPE